MVLKTSFTLSGTPKKAMSRRSGEGPSARRSRSQARTDSVC